MPASIWLDETRWADVPRLELPLDIERSPDLDAFSLRGRLLVDAKFTRMRWTHFILVDGGGVVRSPIYDAAETSA